MTRDVFVSETVKWINRRLAPAGVVVQPDTPLFDSGLIDSMRILRLIAWTEQSTGRIIRDEEIRMDYFRDVYSIADRFCEQPA